MTMSDRSGMVATVDLRGVDLWRLREEIADLLGDYILFEQPREQATDAVTRHLERLACGGELEIRATPARVRAWMTPHGDIVERR